MAAGVPEGYDLARRLMSSSRPEGVPGYVRGQRMEDLPSLEPRKGSPFGGLMRMMAAP